MGVHGLWELLAPVGRRVSVETLAGKKLAIDASIWMVQFMKAMRDEKGEMVRNAHLLGFFRRICKLLFLRTKPVFVFDGGTPALKRRTVIARRRQRENAQAKIRKTAEKLLLNHLKAMRLKELAKNLEDQRQKNDAKGKKVMTAEMDVEVNTSERNGLPSENYNQESIDELLAASLMAEEDGSFLSNASTSPAGNRAEEEDGDEDEDEDEEMILPTMHGKVDPAVLAALPPSMQLDLLVQMRERLIAENRQKYQKIKKAPAKFSELQIQAYLKTIAFRREIHEVQKSAAGRGIGGVQTSRIASEANREFIFSSSFSGDKGVLTSTGIQGTSNEQHQPSERGPPADTVVDAVALTNDSSVASESVLHEPSRIFENDVETYLDDRGRVRVSRVRAMGIRMTRDLQRNLDLMKESEKQRMVTDKNKNSEFTSNANSYDYLNKLPSKIQLQEIADQRSNEKVSSDDGYEQSMSRISNSLEISFEGDDGLRCNDDDDDLFAQLVSEDPTMTFSDNVIMKRQSSNSALDYEWEKGFVREKESTLSYDCKAKCKSSLAEGSTSDESEVEWEEGSPGSAPDLALHKQADPRQPVHTENISKGILEEEADLQEAIRRSIEDLRNTKCIDESIKEYKSKELTSTMNEDLNIVLIHQEVATGGMKTPPENVLQTNVLCSDVVHGVTRMNSAIEMYDLKTDDFSDTQLAPSTEKSFGDKVLIDSPNKDPTFNSECSVKNANGTGVPDKGIEHVESVASVEGKLIHMKKGKLVDTSYKSGEVVTSVDHSPSITHISHSTLVDIPQVSLSAPVEDLSKKTANVQSSVKELMTDVSNITNLIEKIDHEDSPKGREDVMCESALMDTDMDQIKITEASLEEEMLNLGKERVDLGNEQRKLERNAESVNSEMFTECQELLQMFGLPYIIAPMEAEAQCAYLESENLVDGVVTDDSDVFLFGARNVYRNIFDDRKYVETYFLKDIENELGLTREKLIRMALLLGSDYTEGVSGIGIVNAIEVVNAFPEEDGLQKFREWIELPDPSILGKADLQAGSNLWKKSRDDAGDIGCSDGDVEELYQNASQSPDHVQSVKQTFMDKHRNVSKNWHIPSSFPSEAVILAYASAQVDKSTEPFSWGKPDLFILRKLCWEKFGWSSHKGDELLLPVLKEYNKHETQLRLEAFYTFNERFAKIRSKRVKNAVKGITGKKSLGLMDDSVPEVPKGKKKRPTLNEVGDDISEAASYILEDGVARDVSNFMKKSPEKQSRKRTRRNPLLFEGKELEPQNQEEGKLKAKRGSARRRGTGRGRGQSVGKGRAHKSGLEFAETSSDGNSDWDKDQAEKYKELNHVRRSARPRKHVIYSTDNLEIDEINEEHVYGNSADEKAVEAGSRTDQVRIVDAGGYSKEKQDKVGGLLEGFSGNHSEVGNEVRVDEDEPEREIKRVGGEDYDAPFQEEKDYFQTGGGFGLDEDEGEKNPGDCSPFSARSVSAEKLGSSHQSDFVQESTMQTVSSSGLAPYELQQRMAASENIQNLGNSGATTVGDNHGKAAVSEDNMVDEPGTSSVKLSAMPFLKRRHRRR